MPDVASNILIDFSSRYFMTVSSLSVHADSSTSALLEVDTVGRGSIFSEMIGSAAILQCESGESVKLKEVGHTELLALYC